MKALPFEKCSLFLASALLLILVCPIAVISQELMDGTLNTKNFAPLDLTTPVTIHFRRDAEINDRLALVARKALMKRNFVVSEVGPVELFIETEIGADAVANRNVQLSGEGGSRGGRGASVGIQTRIAGDRGKTNPNSAEYRVTMEVTGTGKMPIWWGSATATYRKPDREGAFSDMIERLVGAIGKTLDDRRFNAD